MVVMGTRQSQGLFVSPLNTSTGLGIASISLAIAIGHFVWGAVQPIAGAIADRYGSGRVLATGVLVFAIGSALTPLANSSGGLILTLGILAAAGAGAASFPVLIGTVAGRVPANKRGTATGVINAGSSFGQFCCADFTGSDQRHRLDDSNVVAFGGGAGLAAAHPHAARPQNAPQPG